MVTFVDLGTPRPFPERTLGTAVIDTLYHYRGNAYLLHEFVIMPDHFHVILTP